MDSTTAKPQTHLQKCWHDFCKSTSLHGMRYMVRRRTTAYERVFWVVCVALALSLSVQQIWEVYYRWSSSPQILSVETSAPTWEVPFPAVSVCPRNKTSKFGLAACNTTEGMASSRCISTLMSSTPPLNDVVRQCSWNGISLKVDHELFPYTLSDSGICYTFNMLNNSDTFSKAAFQYGDTRDNETLRRWTLEEGYPVGASWDVYPRRAVGNRGRSGLSLVLRSQGLFKIVVHNPMDLPIVSLANNYVYTGNGSESQLKSVRQFTFYPTPDEETVVNVFPTWTVSSSTLRLVPLERRFCFFPSERQLLYFSVYTQRNCELECVANHTVNVCGCAPIYMPRRKDQPVCQHSYCYANASIDDMNIEGCGCLPSCNSIGYDFQVNHYGWQREYGRDIVMDELEKWAQLSRVSVQIKGSTLSATGRSESYSRPEFLADCGGLLGLFSGFSIMTLVEVVFHFLVQWFCFLCNWTK